ncbi:MAG: glucose-1-phosphate cytidylyltransferase [Phycisphaerales bacterium]|nr:glucose-1-phosphate cytidylyltransferase [Phycisphaerales bacterium]
MKVVILCGGLGTRLREETEFRPKPMVEIGQRPILWHIMKLYAHHGLREFVLCLGYRGNVIKEYILNYEAMNSDCTLRLGDRKSAVYHDAHAEHDFTVTLADTGEDTMTGGRIRRVERYVDGNTFMVTYGDGLADVDLGALLSFHRAHGRLATLTAVRAQSRFGVVDVDPDGRVARFREKPMLDDWVHVGFFVFQRGVFDYLTGDDCVLEREPLERLAAAGQLMAFRHEGFFQAMDTYREYKALSDLWATGRAPWKVWT